MAKKQKSGSKVCVYCGEPFQPAARHWKQQTVCLRERCRKKRNEDSQKRWLNKNPRYFEGRYESLKNTWDYAASQRDYRAENPGYVAADNKARKERRRKQEVREAALAVIQESVARRQKQVLEIRSRRGAVIQETVRLQLDGILDLLAGGESAVIQESMACGGGDGVG